MQLQHKVQTKMGQIAKNTKYTLIVGNDGGVYMSDTLWQLFIEVIKHRFWHFKRGDGWVD